MSTFLGEPQNDPKGELYKATAAARRRNGQRVVRLDAFGVCGRGSHSFNPFDLISSGPECVDDARALAEAMVIRTGEEKDPHWNDQCANVITAILAFVLTCLKGPERSIASLRAITSDPALFDGCATALREMGGVFARLSGVMRSLTGDEKASVLSTLNRHTCYADSEPILRATASGWDARELLTGNVAVYLILPPSQMEAQNRYLRLVVSSLLRLVGQHGMARGKECLMLLDEAGQLGHMQPIEQGLTLLRSSGLRMVLAFQSLSQLKESFKEKEGVLLDNTDHIFFEVRSLPTAQHVSQSIGTYTESARSYSENSGSSHNTGAFARDSNGITYSSGSSVSVSVHARSVLNPDEVMNLPPEVMVGFFRGIPPLLCRRVISWRDPEFQRFGRLKQQAKKAMIALLVGAVMAALVNILR